VCRAIHPADWTNCSRSLLRRSCGFFRGLRSGIGRRAGRSGIGSGGIGSGIGIGSSCIRSSCIRSSVRRRCYFRCRSSRFFGRHFHILLGTAGTQYEGNRNGAQEICIHRQLPQFISLSEKSRVRDENT
jgi:hypothetical protein